MNNIDKGVIQVLDQLKNSGQLNSYLIDDDERKWTKLIYDIMINKFDMPFGNSTMQQASDIFNNAVRVWKGKNKLGNMMNMESRTMNMNIINEIGDTVRGQEMLGRTAERAHQRAQRTSGADKQRHEKTEWDAYQTAAGNSRKHLDGSGAHFARGRDAEYDEHWDDGRYPWSKKHKSKNESKTMNKKLIRLTESDLHRIIKESFNRILKEGYYDFDDDFNADDVECPYCGSNNVEPISAIDTHYRCLDCGEEFYLDGGWEPDWGAMRHESHKRKGKNINEATTPTWKRWQGYTPDQKAERLAYMQQQIAQLKQQREYAKQKAKTARTPEEQQTWRNTKAQIDRELLRVVSHEHDLRVGKKMTQGAKERATIKRREDRAKAKNRITFQPQDDPYYTNE